MRMEVYHKLLGKVHLTDVNATGNTVIVLVPKQVPMEQIFDDRNFDSQNWKYEWEKFYNDDLKS